MRALSVLLLGMLFGLTGCVVYDDDDHYGYRRDHGHWDDGGRHRRWDEHDGRDRHWEERERWEDRRGRDRDRHYHDDD